MPLSNILLDVSSILGIDLSDASELEYHITKVNEAAKELYESADLPDCLREQIFQCDNDETSQLALPSHVGNLRALRYFNYYEDRLTMNDMRPRYHRQTWANHQLLNYRIKSTSSPTRKNIESLGPLTFTLKAAEAIVITIDIIVTTQDSERVKETITFPIGETIKQTTLTPVEIISIVKTSGVSTYNIEVTDINDNLLSVINNSDISPLYTIVQIRDPRFYSSTDSTAATFEALYKLRFRPFVNQADEFICPNCDKLIFWKFSEHYASYNPGMEDRAIAAAIKVKQLKTELFQNAEQGIEMDLEFGQNQMHQIQEQLGRDCTYEYGRYGAVQRYLR